MNDPALPGAAELLGPEVASLLAPAVAGANGQVLTARPTQVRHDPGRRLAVRYAAQVRWPQGQRTETLGALIDLTGLPGNLQTVKTAGIPVGVWHYPHDPFLPGLPHAAYPRGVQQVLRAMGVPADDPQITPLVYRPCQRAVLRVRSRDRLLYVKVVPPAEAAALRATHDAFTRRTPAARCLAWDDELGLLVLESLPGAPMSRVLDGGGRLPSPDTVAGLLRDIRRVALPSRLLGRRVDAAWYAQVLRQAVPDAAGLVNDLAARAAAPAAPADTTIHGDLYPGQLLVDAGAVTGLLDLDGAGVGSPLDDPASVVAHLVALAHVRPAAAGRIEDYRRQLQPLLVADADAELLTSSVTGVLLGLATTPFRRQAPDWPRRTVEWLELANAWTAKSCHVRASA